MMLRSSATELTRIRSRCRNHAIHIWASVLRPALGFPRLFTMRVFVTGCSGLLGGHLIPQLVEQGHIVTALSRSPAADVKLIQRGATPVRGEQTSLEVLAREAQAAEAVIHAAFGLDDMTDPTWYNTACEQDRAAIEAMCDALVTTSGRTFIYTSGTLLAKGPDEDLEDIVTVPPRGLSEQLANTYVQKGLTVYKVRIPPINHGPEHRHAFITDRIAAAKKHGYAGYVDSGDQQWSSCHVKDAARIYVLALASDVASGTVFHAVAEKVEMKRLADYIGERLRIPTKSVPADQAFAHWGFTGIVLGLDDPAASIKTRERLGWEPRGYGLMEEISGYKF